MWMSNALTYMTAANARTLIARLQAMPDHLGPEYACSSCLCCAMVSSQQQLSAALTHAHANTHTYAYAYTHARTHAYARAHTYNMCDTHACIAGVRPAAALRNE